MPTRNLTNLQPSTTYQYLLQTDTANTMQDGLGNPFIPASASYALTASYFSGSVSNSISSSFSLSSATASYVSGSISNIPDPYTTPKVNTIVTLTAAEYAAIVTPDANTFYAVI